MQKNTRSTHWFEMYARTYFLEHFLMRIFNQRMYGIKELQES